MGKRDLTVEDVDKAFKEAGYTLRGLDWRRQKSNETQAILAQLIDELEHPDAPESVRQFIRDLEKSKQSRKD